ncbi:hypothetical protein [Methylobacterium sp. V23]|uniref:hypothetical protein n=1 Tax=Methylobacterium sp. V23 TaxID=2044878 RepID=UPI000CDB4F9A|nr:hypothetical protein [Methylobacterium sp. V23]POR42372.1 hypothetical protein CRT23_12940 [Methylobacterium sp. V23]
MSKTTRRARIGGRERADACLQLSLPFTDHVTTDDRKPSVFRRGGDPQYRMLFTVAGRRYFGPTHTKDRRAAMAFARAAHADVVRARAQMKLAKCVAYGHPTVQPATNA